VSVGSFQYAADPAAAEVCRVLRPGGRLVLTRPEWHDLFTRVLRIALDLGDPGDDARLATLQDEARRFLPVADLMHRVVVTAIAPGRPPAAPSVQGSDPGIAR
jgi:SAM-dependent methyltransferase